MNISFWSCYSIHFYTKPIPKLLNNMIEFDCNQTEFETTTEITWLFTECIKDQRETNISTQYKIK